MALWVPVALVSDPTWSSLLILGLLAGLVGPQVLRYLGSAKSDTAMLQIEELGAGLDLYHLEVGRYPTTDEGLIALVEQPTGRISRRSVFPRTPGATSIITARPVNKAGTTSTRSATTTWTVARVTTRIS